MPDFQIDFDEPAHQYHLVKGGDRIAVPSITQTIGMLTDWSGIDPEVLEKAAQRGTDVHTACELLAGGGDGSGLNWGALDPVIEPYARGFEKFQRDTGWQADLIEWIAGSWKYRFAGRLDLVGVDGKRCGFEIIDIKTGPPHPSHGVQLAGQELALRASYPPHLPELDDLRRKLRRFGLYLTKDATYRLIEYKDPSDHGLFLSCLNITHFKRSLKK